MTATAASAGRANGYVTWSHLLAGLGALATIMCTLVVFLWDAHSAHPHAGAVTQDEMRYFDERIQSSFTDLGRRLDRIDKQLERIK